MTSLYQRLEYTRLLRKRLGNDPELYEFLGWVEGRIVTAMAQSANPLAEQGEGAGGGGAMPVDRVQSRRDWQRNYMRDYRAGRRRRPTTPTASDT